MAETILSVIAGGVLERIGSIFLSQIPLESSVKKDLKKLQMTLSTINAVLLDAEEQQVKSHTVRDWLEKLNEVVYDADDVLLDEISTEDLRQKVEIQGSKLKVVGNFFSSSNPLAFRFKIGRKIKEIRERLDNIAEDMRNFHFMEQVVSNPVEYRVQREQTYSFVIPSNVIGREEDKERIVQLLLSFRGHEDLSVIPIVGFGGLGKTTLAKLVYNDENVVCCFEIRIWVCVSEDFKLKKVLEEILKSATGVECDRLNVDQLQIRLHGILSAKNFLLVLDDVWNDDPKWWTELRDLLTGGANGSTIVVTTRSRKTASIMGTVESYNLSKLPYDDCLSLLMRCALKEIPEKVRPDLVEVGKEIVDKCGGVPLAVKTLGSLLYMKTDVREWLYIRDNDIWKLEQKDDDILPALRLSYQQFQSYLKQCFAYCSIFPEDMDILSENLINLWMAQGFLQSTNGRRHLEDVGNQYFGELVSKSFFEDVDARLDFELKECKMHDLIHDLAQQVAGTEWVNVDFNFKGSFERVRHVSVTEYEFFDRKLPVSLLRAKKLRSFYFSYIVGRINKSFLEKLVQHFGCLRVLHLGGAEYEELPSFVGNLKHLRYLDLRANRCLKALPNSICKLVNLQTLNLSGCEQLQYLPRDIGKLVNLRNLYLTTQMICLPEKRLQGLTSLRSFSLNDCIRLTSLSEGIEHLTFLRTLRIIDCPSLASLPSGLMYLTALENLWIVDCEQLNLLEDEDMRDLRSLRSLIIGGLPKLVGLPQGLQQSAATLQFLCIGDCRGLTTLPEWLQALTSLQILQLLECPNLLSLPEGMQRLTALQRLVIKRCQHLSRRCMKETGEDWPKISHVPQIDIDSYDE